MAQNSTKVLSDPAQAPGTMYFASPDRSSKDEISSEVGSLAQNSSLLPMLDEMPDFVMILNQNRQIIFANRKLSEFGSAHAISSVFGMRPGELLNCEHAASAPSGCGTNHACASCGIVQSILAGLSGESVTRDCRMSAQGVEAFDLRIWASPFAWNASNYVIVIATDISNEKRRKILERIFFHDLLNTAGGIYGITQLMDDEKAMDEDLKFSLCSAAEALVNEIKSQQTLLAAENNELGTSPTRLRSRDVIMSAASRLRNHDIASGKGVVIASETDDFEFISDEALLNRVLVNLLKNAMEASGTGSTITLGARLTEVDIVFWCHNPGVMPPQVQRQIFQRNFSTKGVGRGIGTYSVRLLTERYLGGTVAFDSRESDGTTFRIALPASKVIAESPNLKKGDGHRRASFQ